MALNQVSYDLIVFLEQYYLTHSALPTREAATELGIDPDVYLKNLKNSEFRTALEGRGVPVGAFDLKANSELKSWRDFALTEEQLSVANSMLDLTDNRSRRKKLSEFGVSTQQYESWLRDPTFSAYLRSRSESLLSDSQPDAHLALVDRVRSGDMSAIKYFNELTGRYTPVSAVTSGGGFDTKMVLIRVVEIMQRHLSDQPLILQQIAQELIELSEGPVRLAAPTSARVAIPQTLPTTVSSPVSATPVEAYLHKSVEV